MIIQSSKLAAEVSEARQLARALVEGLASEKLSQRPDPSSWSIAECLSHLNITAAVIQPKIAAAIELGKKEKITGQGPYSPGPLGRLLVWMAEPPPKFRFRAPKEIAPQVGHGDPAEVVTEFMKVQDEWERLIRECEGLDQKKLKIAPVFGRRGPRLRLSAPIPWMMAHQRRHLLQAEKVKQQVLSSEVSVRRGTA